LAFDDRSSQRRPDGSPLSRGVVRLPLLDRLYEGDAVEDLRSPERALRVLREAVRRDLEAVLNTRERCRSWPDLFEELDHSIVRYGLPDIYSLPFATESQREHFRKLLETAVLRAESRFTEVKVTILQNASEVDRSLRFRIQAVLRVDIDGEPVVFDSVLDPASRAFSVSSSAHV
jgi:type VI secretion system protein ImpF